MQNLGPRDFGLALGKWTERMMPEQREKFTRAVSLKALRGVVLMTPVGNPSLWKRPAPPGYVGGRARANWQVGLDAAGAGEVAGVDPSGSGTLAKGSGVIAHSTPFGKIVLYNNLPYIEALEHGHSTQAANGMVAVTLANLRQELA